jgi:hypothetical protein
MSDLNLEVWEPTPIIPVPGTYVSRFNRYYLSINPNPAEGPQTWRISDPDETLVTSVENLDEPILLSNIPHDPMRSLYDNNDKATVTTFYIYGLTYEEFSIPTGRSMRSTVYNSNSSIPVSSSDPIQTASNVASTDLFFNISSLSHAT